MQRDLQITKNHYFLDRNQIMDNTLYAYFYLDVQRDKYNTLIEKLKSKSRLLRFMIKKDNIDISRFI